MTGNSPRRYAIISPAHNEARFLPRVVAAIAGQTVRPVKWIIVDDRSTDQTAAVAREAASTHDFIEVVQLSGDPEHRLGAQVAWVIGQGLKHLHQEVDYLVKLDADIVLPPDFMAEVISRLEANPRLGIASGKIYVEHEGEWIQERFPDFHTPGACKVYKMACFQDIGGWIQIYGWDILDGTKARMRGWETRSFRDLVIHHLRLMGSARGILRGHIGHGRGMWAVRAHPLFVLARALYRAIERPFLSGLLIFAGYLWGGIKGEPRLEDLELAHYLRQEQMSRLLGRRFREEQLLPKRLKK